MNKYINVDDFSDQLKEYGHSVAKLEYAFNRADNRVWGINIQPGDKNVLVFYFRNRNELDEHGFDILSDKRNYFGISVGNIYEAIEQILTGGKYENE